MHAISSIHTYTPWRASKRHGQQASALTLRRADEIRRSRSLKMVLTIAIPVLLVTYLTLGIIRCAFIVSDVVQHTIPIPSSTLRADQRLETARSDTRDAGQISSTLRCRVMGCEKNRVPFISPLRCGAINPATT